MRSLKEKKKYYSLVWETKEQRMGTREVLSTQNRSFPSNFSSSNTYLWKGHHTQYCSMEKVLPHEGALQEGWRGTFYKDMRGQDKGEWLQSKRQEV